MPMEPYMLSTGNENPATEKDSTPTREHMLKASLKLGTMLTMNSANA